LVLQGFAYVALGRYDDAVRVYHAVLAKTPESPQVLYHLAQAQWRAGRPAEAARAARQALTFQPEHRESLAILEQIELAAADGTYRR
jgi:Flp pilus assembly protein TadD